MVITSNGRPIVFLSAVTGEALEDTLTVFSRSRVIGAVSEIQRQSTQKGKDTITLVEVDAEIASVQRARR